MLPFWLKRPGVHNLNLQTYPDSQPAILPSNSALCISDPSDSRCEGSGNKRCLQSLRSTILAVFLSILVNIRCYSIALRSYLQLEP